MLYKRCYSLFYLQINEIFYWMPIGIPSSQITSSVEREVWDNETRFLIEEFCRDLIYVFHCFRSSSSAICEMGFSYYSEYCRIWICSYAKATKRTYTDIRYLLLSHFLQRTCCRPLVLKHESSSMRTGCTLWIPL